LEGVKIVTPLLLQFLGINMIQIQGPESTFLPRILIVGIQSPKNFAIDVESYFEEFRNLIAANNIVYHEERYIKLRSIDAAYFITKGKLAELVALCEKEKIDEVIFSETFAMQQIRNLQKILHADIFDRNELILDIFEKNAHSAEGKLQVELARLQHKKSRVVGRGMAMSQQSGFIGGRGPGETQKEKEIQSIEDRVLRIKRDLEHLDKVRNTQRKQRLTNEIPLICLIGYTNAGKSSLLNALTKSNVLVENKLFSTLDTTTRELFINGKKKGLISDTVGFIQQLPHLLIDAFKSTLDELRYAHLLIHVIDISNKNYERNISVVNSLLHEMGISKPIVHVFNKTDLLSEDELQNRIKNIEKYTPYALTSTIAPNGLDNLIAFLDDWNKQKESAQ